VHHVGFSDFPTRYRRADSGEVCVKAPVESYLQIYFRIFDRQQRLINFCQAVSNRLLAKNMLASLGCLYDKIGMSIGWGADQYRFNIWIRQNLFGVISDARYSATLGNLLGRLATNICNRKHRRFR
jgi:hypothetical protein